ncbi:MAG TPA: DUF3467 domain-containing protein [Candidatus Pacearchaeota archaeon]|jgi:hypothetical protein|nr:DUF3467 domain-containing protein [Candidatus Pacearchaeota archaeon]HPO06806.1 DUF3467 domain-containing protein [Candidatus Pacearchaeota archaeon]
MEEAKKEVKINIPDNLKNGVYSNIANINVSKSEVLMDFIFLAPNEANLVSRIIVSLEHARSIEKALSKLIAEIDNKK